MSRVLPERIHEKQCMRHPPKTQDKSSFAHIYLED